MNAFVLWEQSHALCSNLMSIAINHLISGDLVKSKKALLLQKRAFDRSRRRYKVIV